MTADSGSRPGPQVAYAHWLAACADAGWHYEALIEQVPVRAGLGRVTATAIRARCPSPPFDCAAMDGIAVAFASLDGQAPLAATAFSWVDTGDPMPAGTDTVVERERVELGADGRALVLGTVARARNVRSCGEDFAADHLIVSAGHRLRPQDLGAAASAGYADLAVARQPVVTIIPTGDEIRPVGSVLEQGQFTDSNSVMLAAFATRSGTVPVVTDVQPDDPDVLAAAVREAASSADLVLVLAGSSRGRGDYTATVLAQVGGLAVQGVAVRPGHPVLLGHVKQDQSGDCLHGCAARSAGTVPVIGVPGYPLAAAVIFELFAAPLLARLEGSLAPDRAPMRARLGCDWDSPPHVEDWIPVSLEHGPDLDGPPAAGTAVAVPAAGHGAGAISRLVRAGAWWRIPIGQGQFARGDEIEVLPIRA